MALTQVQVGMGGNSNAPAFSAYNSTTTAIGTGVFTKIEFQTEEFDTNNNFASSRFTPTVAGYYQVNGSVQLTVGATSECVIGIYKNGTVYKYGTDAVYTTLYSSIVSSLVYCNGSTDYLEIYFYCGTAGKTTTALAPTTWFNGCLIRGA